MDGSLGNREERRSRGRVSARWERIDKAQVRRFGERTGATLVGSMDIETMAEGKYIGGRKGVREISC